MERKLRETVIGKDDKDQEIKLAVVRPTQKLIRDAQTVYNVEVARLLRQAAEGGERLLLRSELDDHLERIGVWTQEDRDRFTGIQLEIREMEIALRRGGITLSEGRTLALQMDDRRKALMGHYVKRQQFDSATIEANAENRRFEFLAAKSIVLADTGQPYCADVDDYLEKSTQPVVLRACAKLAQMLFGLDTEAVQNAPEQKWLRQYRFVDAEGRLIDKQAHWVDRTGRLVDENGRYVNEQGQFVDWNGNRVDEQGNLLVEDPSPFLDDQTGQPVEPPAGS